MKVAAAGCDTLEFGKNLFYFTSCSPLASAATFGLPNDK
jgi:hypothetical protein